MQRPSEERSVQSMSKRSTKRLAPGCSPRSRPVFAVARQATASLVAANADHPESGAEPLVATTLSPGTRTGRRAK